MNCYHRKRDPEMYYTYVLLYYIMFKVFVRRNILFIVQIYFSFSYIYHDIPHTRTYTLYSFRYLQT